MNRIDHALASGQMPPEHDMCAKCKKRTDVDLLSAKGRVFKLCAKCQVALFGEKGNREPPPKELPF